jgi:hypothetical protein
MALDPTARSTNVKDSIKKFFVDNLFRSEGRKVTFDKALSAPRIQGNVPASEWISIKMGALTREALSTQLITVYCCTRQDPEGYKLAQLVDTVMGYLTDSAMTDGMKRIPFYRSYESQAWTLLGALIVQDPIDESEEMEASDETKFKILTFRLRFASKV